MNQQERVANTGLSHWFILALRLAMGTLFVWSGLAKMPQPEIFARTVYTFNILPQILVLPAAIAIPWIEFLAGLSLFLGFRTRLSAYVCLGFLFIFAIALSINIFRGTDDIPCGCFGKGTGDTLSAALTRNAVLIAACFPLIRLRLHRWCLDGLIHKAKQPEASNSDPV